MTIFIPDDIEIILKKLSLEKYHPIFEEQEVCNEMVSSVQRLFILVLFSVVFSRSS